MSAPVSNTKLVAISKHTTYEALRRSPISVGRALELLVEQSELAVKHRVVPGTEVGPPRVVITVTYEQEVTS